MKPTNSYFKERSVNKYIYQIIINYFKMSSKKELRNDILVPLVLSLIIMVPLISFEPKNMVVLETLGTINTISLTVIAILAGFNTTSLSIIAGSNKTALKELLQNGEKDNILKQVITFFSYAIMLQLAILIIGLLLLIFIRTLPGIVLTVGYIGWYKIRFILAVFSIVWCTVVLYGLFVSLRNVSLIYQYILFVGRN